MKEIEIIAIAPVIFTKDAEFMRNQAERLSIEPGAINLLPEDAILYVPPETYSIEVKPAALPTNTGDTE